MGNRAVITTENKKIGVYLHWNGGRDSIEAFLEYCKLKGYTSPERDCYGWARLCQVIGNFFGGSLSLGIDLYDRLDKNNGDNGVYVIKDWKIVDRLFFDGVEQHEYDLKEMLIEIDNAQPQKEQLGDYLTAEEIDIKDLKIGDEVITKNWREEVTINKVLGFGKDEYINGFNVNNLPIIDLFNGHTYEDCKDNINNYIRQDKVKIKKGE